VVVGGVGGSFESEYVLCIAYIALITSLNGVTAKLAVDVGTEVVEDELGEAMLRERGREGRRRGNWASGFENCQ